VYAIPHELDDPPRQVDLPARFQATLSQTPALSRTAVIRSSNMLRVSGTAGLVKLGCGTRHSGQWRLL